MAADAPCSACSPGHDGGGAARTPRSAPRWRSSRSASASQLHRRARLGARVAQATSTPCASARRLWVCPRHERVSRTRRPWSCSSTRDWPSAPARTPSTALCLEWLDAHLAAGAQRHRLRLRLGRARARRRQARRAARCTASTSIRRRSPRPRERRSERRRGAVHVHAARRDAAGRCRRAARQHPRRTRCCDLAPHFAALRAPGRLGGARRPHAQHEVADVTAAYGACFDVRRSAGATAGPASPGDAAEACPACSQSVQNAP